MEATHRTASGQRNACPPGPDSCSHGAPPDSRPNRARALQHPSRAAGVTAVCCRTTTWCRGRRPDHRGSPPRAAPRHPSYSSHLCGRGEPGSRPLAPGTSTAEAAAIRASSWPTIPDHATAHGGRPRPRSLPRDGPRVPGHEAEHAVRPEASPPFRGPPFRRLATIGIAEDSPALRPAVPRHTVIHSLLSASASRRFSATH
jgi:hypothetical protein